MRGDIDSILRQLHEVGSELDGVGPDEVSRRVELRARQDELRARAKAIRDSVPDNPHELRRLLEGLHAQRKAILAMHVDLVRQAGGGEGRVSGNNADAMKLNRAIDEGAGLAEIEAKILRLEERLAAMDGSRE